MPASRPVGSLSLDFTGGAALDSKITFTRATSAWYFDSAGTLTDAGSGNPRFDYNPSTLAPLGLLIEEQRTNSIRNSTMVGAAAPSTKPTNWGESLGGLTGLTSAYSNAATESGITYIDWHISGTPSAAGTVQLSFDTTTAITAANGDVWTATFYYKLSAGTLTGITTTRIGLAEQTSLGAFIVGGEVILTAPSASGLATQRALMTRTLSGGVTTARIQGYAKLYLSGAAIDITLRIGLPQLELGAFATSAIPTSTVAVTRNADSAVISTLTPWFNASEGTFVVQAIPNVPGATSQVQVLVSVNGGDTTNRMQLYRNVNGGDAAAGLVMSSTASGNYVNFILGGVWTQNVRKRAAFAYKNADYKVALAGTDVVTSTAAGTLPVVTALDIGSRDAGAIPLNGWMQSLQYFPRRLPDSMLRALSQ